MPSCTMYVSAFSSNTALFPAGIREDWDVNKLQPGKVILLGEIIYEFSLYIFAIPAFFLFTHLKLLKIHRLFMLLLDT